MATTGKVLLGVAAFGLGAMALSRTRRRRRPEILETERLNVQMSVNGGRWQILPMSGSFAPAVPETTVTSQSVFNLLFRVRWTVRNGTTGRDVQGRPAGVLTFRASFTAVTIPDALQLGIHLAPGASHTVRFNNVGIPGLGPNRLTFFVGAYVNAGDQLEFPQLALLHQATIVAVRT